MRSVKHSKSNFETRCRYAARARITEALVEAGIRGTSGAGETSTGAIAEAVRESAWSRTLRK